jgi:ParB-like chromosome segregation protein Spo0J
MEQVIEIPLKDTCKFNHIPERELDTKYVESLIASNNPGEWPPIIVTASYEGLPQGKYACVTGQHRIAAAWALQLPTIRAVVRQFSSDTEITIARWEDNLKHGHISHKERKEAAILFKSLHPEMSFREIGRRVGLSDVTAKNAIESAQATRTGDERQDSYNATLRNEIKRLKTALKNVFEKEYEPRKVLGVNMRVSKANAGADDTEYRAFRLAYEFADEPDAIAILKSLAQSCQIAADKLAQSEKKGAQRGRQEG